MITVRALSHEAQCTSAADRVTIGSAPGNDLVVPGVADEVAVLKQNVGTWILRLRDPRALIVDSTDRRVFITDARQRVSIRAPEYSLDIQVDSFSENKPRATAQRGRTDSAPVFPAVDTISIGSGPGVLLRISDPSIEARHAVVSSRPGNVWIVSDQGSSTGTYVDGNAVTRSRLSVGSLVTFGGVTLTWPDGFLVPRPVVTKQASVMHPSIGFTSVTVGYPGKAQPALTDVNLQFGRGRLTAIVGPSGVGKSTLCRAILGEIEIRSGRLTIDGAPRRDGFAPNPQQVSFVPQDTSLTEELTVRQVVDYASEVRNARSRAGALRKADADEVLENLGLAGIANRRVSQLSGGEKKRVSIAQELVTQPLVLLLDEPSSGLDEGLDYGLMHGLKALTEAPDAPSVIVVTHATNHLSIADDVCVIGEAPRNILPAATSAVRYMGAPERLLGTLGTGTFAELMDSLRPTRRREDDTRTASTFRHHFCSQGGLGALLPILKREWMLARPRLLRTFIEALGVPLLVAALLGAVNTNGLGTSQSGDNPALLTTITMLVLLLCFWSLYKPTMRVVADWPVARREQRWGVSARLHLLARFVWDLPLVFLVPTATVMILLGCTRTNSAPVSWSMAWHVVMILCLTCVSCYALGLLVGAASGNSVSAIQRVVLIIAGMIVFSGALFYLPDVAALDLVSNSIPSRLAIAELASTLNVAQARGTVLSLDPKFTSSAETRLWMVGGLTLIATCAALGAALVVPRTMRRLDRKD